LIGPQCNRKRELQKNEEAGREQERDFEIGGKEGG